MPVASKSTGLVAGADAASRIDAPEDQYAHRKPATGTIVRSQGDQKKDYDLVRTHQKNLEQLVATQGRRPEGSILAFLDASERPGRDATMLERIRHTTLPRSPPSICHDGAASGQRRHILAFVACIFAARHVVDASIGGILRYDKTS